MASTLPIEEILSSASPAGEEAGGGTVIGRSRQGRPIRAYRLGAGVRSLSLIAGCHADEPVGPAMLARLVAFLSRCDRRHTLLTDFRWLVIPQLNPDGARRNSAWTEDLLAVNDHQGREDRAYDPVLYVRHVARELPGDDIEFGFPRSPEDSTARPENLAATGFLAPEGPFALHASFHGMGLAPGPWFLLEPGWIDRTLGLRDTLRQRVHGMGYQLFDVDRRGEKGFRRIDAGFSTRPDSGAMIDHFEARGDRATAALFRPSSMEWARSRGGDPLTLVSEMPLFLLPERPVEDGGPAFAAGTAARRQLLEELRQLSASLPHAEALFAMQRLGIRPMPIGDQMRLQLVFLSEALDCLGS